VFEFPRIIASFERTNISGMRGGEAIGKELPVAEDSAKVCDARQSAHLHLHGRETTAQERMIRMYDRAMFSSDYRQYYEDSGFYNFGYWDTQAKSQREASEALVDQLVDRIPNKGGRILDVACGPGGSTRRLMRSYAPDMITAVNISAAQVAEARKRAPGCTIHRMDATRLDFPEAQFDAVICVEAAFHFDTRDIFLREALRILKPGGSIVLSDMLFREFLRPFAEYGQVPRANLVSDIANFRARFEAAGFEAIDVQDATQACLGGFRRHLPRWPASQRRRGRMKFWKSIGASLLSPIIAGYFGLVCKTYVMASARKPMAARR
jgi:MPBQ/MSBQ methyltransferase